MKVAKIFDFHAAHKLPKHDGQCRDLHGHTYKLEVIVDGLLQEPNETWNPEEGMVLDFGRLKEIWKEHLEPLVEHKYLNETLENIVPVTTCEMMATWFRDTFFHHLSDTETGPFVVHVRLWETPTSYAEV